MAKISELNTKSFLGADGAATNSYILINYEDTNTNEPVTCKATVEELGKAIASHLQLTRVGQSGALSTYLPTEYNSWADDGAYEILSTQQKDFLEDLQENPPWASTGAINTEIYNAINGLASTGYVTDAITDALGNIPGGTGTINLADSYPFVNDSGVLPESNSMEHPKSLVAFVPFESNVIGPPYVHLPGTNKVTPVNLAGPYVIYESENPIECINIFMNNDTHEICTLDTESTYLMPLAPSCVGNFIKTATVEDGARVLCPLFIDTTNNTLYTFNNIQDTWQAISL